jgi:hypothetical protein
MVVLIEICDKCNYVCDSVYFKHNFENWTSGNNDIDKFIQSIQLLAHNEISNVLEWIPYDRLYDINYVTESDKFKDKVYRANWIGSNISYWNHNKNINWKRDRSNMIVILKVLNNPANITSEFMNKV